MVWVGRREVALNSSAGWQIRTCVFTLFTQHLRYWACNLKNNSVNPLPGKNPLKTQNLGKIYDF